MSLRDYQVALPELFSAPETTQSASPKASWSDSQGTIQPLVEETVDTSKPSESTPTKGFVDIVEYRANGDVEIIPTERFLPNKNKKKSKKQKTYRDYAIVLRRTWVEERQLPTVTQIELEIQSQALCEALRKIVVDSYESTDLQSYPIKFRSPFSELFFYRDEIKALKDDENNSNEVREGAEALNDFLLKNGLMKSIVADHERYSTQGHVAGDILWTIYPPNSLLVLNDGGIQECWICRNVSTTPINQGRDGYLWDVVGFRIGYDGLSTGLTWQSCQIPVTETQVCKISELPLIPIKDYQDWPLLKKTLHSRAARLQKVLGRDFSAFASQTNSMRNGGQLDGRVVVDYKAFLDYNRYEISLQDFRRKPKHTKSRARARGIPNNAKRDGPSYPDTKESDSDSDSEHCANIMEPKTTEKTQEEPGDAPQSKLDSLDGLSEAVEEVFHISGKDFNLLFPALVPAFDLKKKEWWWVLSDQLQDVAWNMAAFEFLQLEEETKHLVQALVKGHKANSTAFDDVVPGKGQGLVFLLHGKPGLGKTLTAESVADYLERPLFSISSGELSTNVKDLEETLEEIFTLTKRWDTVCLLDEADVLLCKRNSAGMDRNAIVAVFLRMIEYFQGVLFLTTNRKQDFDEAFKSRIHVTISYGDLSDDSQSVIWERLIAANKNVQVDDSWTAAAFEALGKLQFNGRTIKNILRTAVAYANADNEALGLRHVMAIVQTELKDVDEELSATTDSLESSQKTQVKTALDDLQRLLS
ncbi:hypothetical protein CDV36_008156 [Fusarium kuroshium]|uniref:AAA+ ATPase domain-containing protein n=1 Tax=Fusarium kuroshium TaxID=2010991 RepID=A0A3M2S4Q7_9HYPO|nr:hypothetical protein CDV36_008156 [Fusarium kuroshium]